MKKEDVEKAAKILIPLPGVRVHIFFMLFVIYDCAIGHRARHGVLRDRICTKQ